MDELKKTQLIVSVLFFVMVACSSSPDNEEVVAIVRDKEITIGDIRLFYHLDEMKLSEAVNQYVREEIMVQEAKRMELDISEQVEELRSLNSSFPGEQNSQQAKKAENKAEELGMTKEEYYQEYLEKSIERSAYINEYLEETIGEPEKEIRAEAYTEKAVEQVDRLLTKYAEEIEVQAD